MDLFSKLDSYIESTKEEEKTPIGDECCGNQSKIINNNSGKTICSNCGQILVDFLYNDSPEWSFDKDSSSSRCEKNVNLLLPGMASISYISGNKYTNIQRLHLWHRISSKERSLYQVFQKINKILEDYAIPKHIVQEAKYYYKQLCNDNKIEGILTRGNIRSGFISACIYIACKNNNHPLKVSEIAKICNIDISIVTTGIKKFSNIEKSKNIRFNNNTNNIHDYITRYCRLLNISEELTKLVHLIYERALKIMIITNNTISTICAGIIYMMSIIFELGIKKRDIIKVIKISEVTLNKSYKLFDSYKKILFYGIIQQDKLI